MATPLSPLLKKVVISGVDVSSYILNYEVVSEANIAIGTATITLNRNVGNVLIVDDTLNNSSVTIQRGVTLATEQYIFRGEIIKVTIEPGRYVVECRDKYYEAQRSQLTVSFDQNIDSEAGVISEIFKTMVNDYCLTLAADNTSVQNSGTTFTLQKFVCNHIQVYERLDALAKALGWQHYYDPVTDKVFFEPLGYVDSGTTLTVGQEIVNNLKWEYDSSKLCNQLKLLGAQQLVGKTIFQDGTNANAQKVILPFVPTSVKVYVGASNYDPNGTGTKPSDNNTNLKVGGKKGSTSGTYDYVYDDDREVKTVYFADTAIGAQPSLTPSANTSNIEIQYHYNLPTPVFGKRQASIDIYQLNEKTINKDDIKNVSDAEVYVNKYLDRFSTPLPSTVANVNGTNDLIAGRKYLIVDSHNNISESIIAMKLKRFFPYKADELTVQRENSDEFDFDTKILDRVKRLEETQSETSDLLVQLFTFELSSSLENKYFKILSTNIVGDVGIYSHPVYGIFGTSKYGQVAGAGVTILRTLVHGNNEYKELIYDDEFLDSVNSTCIFDYVNKEIEF